MLTTNALPTFIMAQNRLGLATFSKQNQTWCSVLKPPFGHDALLKIQENTLAGTAVSGKQFCPAAHALDEVCMYSLGWELWNRVWLTKRVLTMMRTGLELRSFSWYRSRNDATMVSNTSTCNNFISSIHSLICMLVRLCKSPVCVYRW